MMVHPFWGWYIFWIGFFVVVFSFRWLKSWPFYPRSLEVTNSLSKRITFFTIPPKKRSRSQTCQVDMFWFVHLFRKSGGWNQHNTPRSRSKANRQSPGNAVKVGYWACVFQFGELKQPLRKGMEWVQKTRWWWCLKKYQSKWIHLPPNFREWKFKEWFKQPKNPQIKKWFQPN